MGLKVELNLEFETGAVANLLKKDNETGQWIVDEESS